jgi:hypothetical protein
MPERIAWETPLVTEIAWGFIFTERGYFMYQHTSPVRKDNPQHLTYTFRKRSDGSPIDLSAYARVKLSVKTAGIAEPVLYDASFSDDKTTGVVYIEDCVLANVGSTSLQFIAYLFISYTEDDEPLHGDIALIDVVKNNADLTVDELPTK